MNANIMQPVASLASARRICAAALALAIALTAALLALAALASLDVALPFPRTLRIALAAGGATALLAWIVLRWRQAWLRHTHRTAAHAMEAARPEFGQQFRTALEVAQRGVPKDAEPEAKLFAARLISQADKSLRRFSWAGLVPRRTLAIWLALGIAAAGAIVFGASRSPDFRLALSRIVSPGTAGTYTRLGWTVAPRVFDERHPPRFELRVERRLAEPSLFVRERGGDWVKTSLTALPDGRSWDIVLTGRTSDLELYATAGDARTATHAVSFQPIAKVTATRVHLAYPDYTGLEPEDRKQGDVSVVEGTQVRWEFTFNVPPKIVEWRIGADPPQRLTVDPASKTASVEWNAGASRCNATVSVLDDSGEAIDSWHYTAEGFPDALPTVEILEPAKDREATSITELPVRIRAKDDFGISEIGLILEAGGQREWVLEKVIPERNQKDVTEIATVSLEKVPLTLRDNVRIYAYALDHKPRGGPRAVSPLRSIDIREFKKRWRFIGGDAAGGAALAGLRIQISNGLMKLGELITAQRSVVSDTFLLRENTRSAGAAVTASAHPIAEREAGLSTKAAALGAQWEEGVGISRDDVELLDTARAQMEEAATLLGLKGPANLDPGFATTDRALSTLLQLRKALLTLLMKGTPGAADDSQAAQPQDQMKSLSDLAKEAERLAREERDVRGQLAPEVAAGTNLDATRHQHEVAVSDGGELYATIVDHPEVNEEAIRPMGEAEKAQHAADETLHGAAPRTAPPLLETAEQRLLDVAKFLRAMDLPQAAETLNKLAGTAEQNAQGTRDPSSQGKGEGQGSGKPDSEAKAGEQKDPVEQAAHDTALADKILGALAEKAGGAGKEGDAETGKAGEKGLGETLSELRKQTAPDKLAEELGKLAEARQKGGANGAEAGAKANAAAGKLDAMAREFRGAAQRLAASRAAMLALAQAQAKDLEKQLAAAGEKPGNKPGAKPGGKDGEKGSGAGEKPGDAAGAGKGEKAGAGDGQNGKGAGEKPGSAAGLASGEKPGEQGAGQAPGKDGNGAGAGKDGTPGEKPGGQGVAKDGPPGSGAGEKPVDAKQNGGNGIAGDIENAQDGAGSQAMGRFSKTLRSIGDDRLHDLAIKLFNQPFSRDSIPAVQEAAERIGELIAALPAAPAPLAATGRVPESRRREVEDYFRNLSDDFGGEKWEAPVKPGQKSE